MPSELTLLMTTNRGVTCRGSPMVKSLDFDPTSIQAAKSSFNVSQGFKHSLSFSSTPVKFFREVRVGRVQELHVIPFVQVQDELTDILEAHLRPALKKGNDFSLRVRFVLHIHSPSDAT